MAHAQKPDSVFQRNGRVHLYRRGCQFSRVLAFLECGSRENDCSNTGWTVPSQTEDCLATHSIHLFPLHFSSRASPCATRFRFHFTFCSLITLATPRQDWTGSNPSRRESGGCGFTLSRSHNCCAVRLVYTQISPGHIFFLVLFISHQIVALYNL